MYIMVCSSLLQVVIKARETRFKEKQLRSLTEDLTKTHLDQHKQELSVGKNIQSRASYPSGVGGELGVSQRERIAVTSMTSSSEDPSTTGSSSYGHSGVPGFSTCIQWDLFIGRHL